MSHKSIILVSVLFLVMGLLLVPCLPPAYAVLDTRTSLAVDLESGVNPNGIMLSPEIYRRWVYAVDKEMDVPSSYLQTGLRPGVSPAYGKLSAYTEWLAAIFAKFRLEYDLYRFFGTNGALLSFPSADSRFGRQEVEALKGQEETAFGSRVLFQPTLYGKIGPVIIANQTDLAYYRFNGKGPYFLDWEYDALVRDGDSVVANRTQFIVEAWKKGKDQALYAGPYYEITHATSAALTRQRVGVLAYWLPVPEFRSLDRPRIYLQAGVNVQDRNRQGELFLNFGIGFDFDFTKTQKRK